MGAIKPILKLPDSKGGWFSLLLGISLLFASAAHAVAGDWEQASLDLAGAFGTVGLPALVGKKGYHLEIRPDRVVDASPPKGFEGQGRLTDTNEDLDAPFLPPVRKPGPSAEVRRGDEL